MSLKKHVEERIFKNKQYMIVGNLSPDEFTEITEYCNNNFDGNRKLMIQKLIEYKEGETPLRIFDDKITLIYNEFNDRITKLEETLKTILESLSENKTEEVVEKEKVRPTWKGFGK